MMPFGRCRSAFQPDPYGDQEDKRNTPARFNQIKEAECNTTLSCRLVPQLLPCLIYLSHFFYSNKSDEIALLRCLLAPSAVRFCIGKGKSKSVPETANVPLTALLIVHPVL
jgi:hypothetical protein